MLKNLKDFSGAWKLGLPTDPAFRMGVLGALLSVVFLLPFGQQSSLSAQPKDSRF